MIFGILVELILYKTGQMRAHHTCFMGRGPRSIIPDSRVFTEGYADRNNLDLVS